MTFLDPHAPTAFISVSDKTGLADIAQAMVERFSYQLIATGGTYRHLAEAGIPVIDSTELTGFGELAGGRVKSLQPDIFAGILSPRDDEALKCLIDTVIVNLYPFEQKLAEGLDDDALVEHIDIGGPSLIRAAAKNHRYVNVLCTPAQYEGFAKQLIMNDGETTLAFRKHLAATAFNLTARYDAAIDGYFAQSTPPSTATPVIPALADNLTLNLAKLTDLRYGENPHQQAALYTLEQGSGSGYIQHHGKALSYNNLVDMFSAWGIVQEFHPDNGPVCAVIKHNNPCGVATGTTLADAWHRAFFADSLSAFGGVVAFNQPVDKATADQMTDIFLEVVIAPSFDDDAINLLNQKKNIRLIERAWNEPSQPPIHLTMVDGQRVLAQRLAETQPVAIDTLMAEGYVNTVTRKKPTASQLDDMRFAWKVVKHVKSNAIVLAKDGQTVGIGVGQTSRIGALEIALRQACDATHGAVMASDGFLPALDNVQAAIQARVGAIIQPGGSIKDKDVVALADQHDLPMLTTGIREFRH